MRDKQRLPLTARLGASLLLALGAAAWSGPAALAGSAGEPVEWVCQVPPEGLEKTTKVAIVPGSPRTGEPALAWAPNQGGACFASRGSTGESEIFELLVCHDRPGRSLGTQVESSRTGRIRSRTMGCELAQRP